MATQVLFRSACPSCETQIPIRDGGLVGKKVECPKCKYRFLVEEPEGYEPAEDEAPKGKKVSKKAKKSGGNPTLLIGAGVGVVAVGVLAAVAYFMFIKEDPKPTSPPSRPAVANTENNNAANTAAANANEAPKDDNTTNTAAKTADPPKETTSVQSVAPLEPAGSSGDISNILPNGSHLVININVKELSLNSKLGEQLFESKIGFRPNFLKERLGISIDEMERLVRGEDVEQKWAFNVLRTSRPMNFGDMVKKMGLVKAKEPIKGREYYNIPAHDLLDNLSAAFKTDAEVADMRNKKDEAESGPLALVMLDESTVVIASRDPLIDFLNRGARFNRITKPTKRDADGAPQPGGLDGPRPGRGGRGMSTLMSMQLPGAGGGGTEETTSDNATYLTVHEDIKLMFDQLDRDPRTKPIFTFAMQVQKDPKLLPRFTKVLGGLNILPADGMVVLGMSLTKFELEKTYGTLCARYANENNVKLIETALKRTIPLLARILALYLGGIKIETEGTDGAGGGGNQPGGISAGPGPRSDSGGGSGSGPPGTNPQDEGPTSKIKLSRKSHYIILEAELNTIQRAHDRIYAMTEAIVTKIRGLVEMAAKVPAWDALSAASLELYQKNIDRENGPSVPPATHRRPDGTGGRLDRNWPPHQRVSWMADLLPYLRHEDVHKMIDVNKTWRDEKNLKAGSIIIPTFLDPRYPAPTWTAALQSLDTRRMGATHYVGMAGVGLDATDFNPRLEKDPARKAEMEKKMGVFGYDRPMPIKDVTDGAANTIYMIQVPPDYQRPWIAGGGATAMGAPETNSIRPFVRNHGKSYGRGTLVLMLDGSVRFIKEDVSDEVFKSLCTVKGGETISDLDRIAPKAAKPTEAEMKTDDKEKAESGN